MDRLFAALPLLISMACDGDLPTNPTANVGTEFTLRPGGTATIPDANLKLKLERVTDDSRCPVDVTCVWEGDAVAVVRVIPTGGTGTEETEQLHINKAAERPGEIEQNGYVIKFVSLAPAARSTRPIKAEDYRATFVVQRR